MGVQYPENALQPKSVAELPNRGNAISPSCIACT